VKQDVKAGKVTLRAALAPPQWRASGTTSPVLLLSHEADTYSGVSQWPIIDIAACENIMVGTVKSESTICSIHYSRAFYTLKWVGYPTNPILL